MSQIALQREEQMQAHSIDARNEAKQEGWPDQTQEQKAEEERRLRRLQWMVNMVMQVVRYDRGMRVEQASEMVAATRRAALMLFPDKALAFDLILWPRLQRLMRERYRMQ